MSVYTAPLAIVRVNGIGPIAKIKDIRVNEQVQRGEVRGLGEITPSELPALSWAGTITCDMYMLDFKSDSAGAYGLEGKIPDAFLRNANTLKEWVNSIILQQDGAVIDLYSKVPANPNQVPMSGIIVASQFDSLIAQVRGVFLDGEGFNVSEGQIATRNQSFKYKYPIIFPV
jgi:hypothetical protein